MKLTDFLNLISEKQNDFLNFELYWTSEHGEEISIATSDPEALHELFTDYHLQNDQPVYITSQNGIAHIKIYITKNH